MLQLVIWLHVQGVLVHGVRRCVDRATDNLLRIQHGFGGVVFHHVDRDVDAALLAYNPATCIGGRHPATCIPHVAGRREQGCLPPIIAHTFVSLNCCCNILRHSYGNTPGGRNYLLKKKMLGRNGTILHATRGVDRTSLVSHHLAKSLSVCSCECFTTTDIVVDQGSNRRLRWCPSKASCMRQNWQRYGHTTPHRTTPHHNTQHSNMQHTQHYTTSERQPKDRKQGKEQNTGKRAVSPVLYIIYLARICKSCVLPPPACCSNVHLRLRWRSANTAI